MKNLRFNTLSTFHLSNPPFLPNKVRHSSLLCDPAVTSSFFFLIIFYKHLCMYSISYVWTYTCTHTHYTSQYDSPPTQLAHHPICIMVDKPQKFSLTVTIATDLSQLYRHLENWLILTLFLLPWHCAGPLTLFLLPWHGAGPLTLFLLPWHGAGPLTLFLLPWHGAGPVSYTHLTLPTIRCV